MDWRVEQLHSLSLLFQVSSRRRRRSSHCSTLLLRLLGQPGGEYVLLQHHPALPTASSFRPSSDREQTEITIVLIHRLVRTAVSACERKLCKLTSQPEKVSHHLKFSTRGGEPALVIKPLVRQNLNMGGSSPVFFLVDWSASTSTGSGVSK